MNSVGPLSRALPRKPHHVLLGAGHSRTVDLHAQARALRPSCAIDRREIRISHIDSTATRRAAETAHAGAPAAWPQSRRQHRTSPVMFPPGRARLATRPVATGSAAVAITIGMVAVACLGRGLQRRRREATITSDVATNELGRLLRSDPSAFGPATIRSDVLTFDSPLPQALRNAPPASAWETLPLDENADAGIAGCCARAASGHARRAAEQRDEVAPSHAGCLRPRARLPAA